MAAIDVVTQLTGAEQIHALGYWESVWRVFKAWTRSSPHRANMLDRRFRHAGVGVVFARGSYWITMMFYG